jgi:hypothetical protein
VFLSVDGRLAAPRHRRPRAWVQTRGYAADATHDTNGRRASNQTTCFNTSGLLAITASACYAQPAEQRPNTLHCGTRKVCPLPPARHSMSVLATVLQQQDLADLLLGMTAIPVRLCMYLQDRRLTTLYVAIKLLCTSQKSSACNMTTPLHNAATSQCKAHPNAKLQLYRHGNLRKPSAQATGSATAAARWLASVAAAGVLQAKLPPELRMHACTTCRPQLQMCGCANHSRAASSPHYLGFQQRDG